MRNKALTIAIATKGYKTKELKTWKQIGEYQDRGWKIALTKEYFASKH